MSVWVLVVPLAEYARSTEAFVACRVTRQIFATIVSGRRFPRAAAGLSRAANPHAVDVGLQAPLRHGGKRSPSKAEV